MLYHWLYDTTVPCIRGDLLPITWHLISHCEALHLAGHSIQLMVLQSKVNGCPYPGFPFTHTQFSPYSYTTRPHTLYGSSRSVCVFLSWTLGYGHLTLASSSFRHLLNIFFWTSSSAGLVPEGNYSIAVMGIYNWIEKSYLQLSKQNMWECLRLLLKNTHWLLR